MYIHGELKSGTNTHSYSYGIRDKGVKDPYLLYHKNQ